MEVPSDWEQADATLKCQAEVTRFSIHASFLMKKQLSKVWNEGVRAMDVKKEMGALRAIIGDKQEAKWVPKPMLDRLVQLALKKK